MTQKGKNKMNKQEEKTLKAGLLLGGLGLCVIEPSFCIWFVGLYAFFLFSR